MEQTSCQITWNFTQVFASDVTSGNPEPDIALNREVPKMKKAYEDMAKFVRWAIIGVIAVIVALPALTSVSSSI
jgi:hypothetical protein